METELKVEIGMEIMVEEILEQGDEVMQDMVLEGDNGMEIREVIKAEVALLDLMEMDLLLVSIILEEEVAKDKVKGTLLAHDIAKGSLYKLLSQDDFFSNSEVQVFKLNSMLPMQKGYKCLDKSSRIYISRYVVFNESEFSYPDLFSISNNSSSIPTKCITPTNQSFTHISLPNPHLDDSNVVAPLIATSEPRSGTQLPVATPEPNSLLSHSPASTNIPFISSIPSISIHPMVTRAKSRIFKPKTYLAAIQDIKPTSVKATLSSQKWYMAMKEEVNALHRNQTWTLVPSDSASKIPYTTRIILSLEVMQHWTIRQLDINNVFLNGVLTEYVYMHQPEGFIDSKSPYHICKLNKALHGLKQAPRTRYDQLKGSLVQWGFQTSKSDTSLFIKHTGADILVILIYLDDILITGSNTQHVEGVISKLGSIYFLGIKVTPSLDGLHLSQTKYIGDILQKAHMLGSKGYNTPMSTIEKLRKENGVLFENPSLYRSIIGSLQYVTLTRPDIAFSVNKLSQFLVVPIVLHWQACKRVLRYLQSTTNYGLQFLSSSFLLLNAYSDADWGSDPDDRKSIGGYCVFLGNNLVS
ncbi:retrovirus-related pol polyprotein from transposon RE2 [Citrus sinensis]|nr:retrovirus-related pol polyprotein from transposon RE2 [Citrus sinensis]